MNGPYPVVMFLHGRHATCASGGLATLAWPCPSGSTSIPSYQGYQYVANNIASYGFIVISISANGINARDNSAFDLGALARAQLMQRHFDIWNDLSTNGGAPFGDRFIGALALWDVGTMGHSRGGEGVVRHFTLNASLGSPYGVKAVIPLAPVNFNRTIANNAALEVILPYCDGDVSDLQGVHFYDDARYNVPGDMYVKHTLLVMGANHNFFNTVWTPGLGPAGAADDWTAFQPGGTGDPWCGTVPGSHRLSAAQQRAVGNAYMTAFYRAYLQWDSSVQPYLTSSSPPPPSIAGTDVHASYHAEDTPQARRDLNRLLTQASLTTNELGGAVTITSFTPGDLCGGNAPQPQHCLPGQPTSRQPHTTPSARSSARGLSQLRGGWTGTGVITNAIPDTTCAGGVRCRDVSGYDSFQFRVGVNFSDARNPPNMPRDFRVVLTDASGASSSLAVSSVSNALYYPPGTVNPKVLLNTVRLPIVTFANDIDVTNVASVQFVFDSTTSGAVLITDLAFSTGP